MWINALCMLTGATFILIAAIGILRMPDLIMRMHAATKAGTLGSGLILTTVIFYFQQWNVTIECILTIFFIFITTPIASHLLARASYLRKIKQAKLTITDE